MMEPNDLLSFIKENGFKTKKEICDKFSEQNQEIVEMQIKYLIDKHLLRQVFFESISGKEGLFYIPYLGD